MISQIAARLKADPCPLCSFEIRMPCYNETTECLEIRCLLCGSVFIVPEEVLTLFKDAV